MGVRQGSGQKRVQQTGLSVLHPLVDACSEAVLVVGGMAWERILAYDAIQ